MPSGSSSSHERPATSRRYITEVSHSRRFQLFPKIRSEANRRAPLFFSQQMWHIGAWANTADNLPHPYQAPISLTTGNKWPCYTVSCVFDRYIGQCCLYHISSCRTHEIRHPDLLQQGILQSNQFPTRDDWLNLRVLCQFITRGVCI